MKQIALALLFLAVAGCHSRDYPGAYRLGEATIEPVETGILQRMLYRKPVLLTFDDGPEDLAVDRSILATLAKHHARALWLVTCKHLDPAMDPDAREHREALREIVAQGQLIGNHGYSHVDLRSLDASAVQHEIEGCSNVIQRLTRHKPKYFRPPFGAHSPRVDEILRSDRLQLLLWGENSYDSFNAEFKRHPSAYVAYIRSHPAFDVSSTAASGDVLLFHDFPNTALALDEILTRLEQRHFQFVVPQSAGDGRNDRTKP